MKHTKKTPKDDFLFYIKKEYPENFWFYLRKINERLEILFKHKVPNHFDLDEADEALLFECYQMYKKSSLYQPSDDITPDEVKRFTDKVSA